MSLRFEQIVCAALLLAACGAQNNGATTARVRPEQRTDTLLGKLDLARDLEATVLENYMQLTLGNFEAYADGIARDRDIVLIGISARDLVVGKEPAGARRDRRPYSDLGVKLLAKNLDVHLSEDASVGWVHDDVSYRVAYSEREASIPLRFTGVFVRDVDRWVMVVEHMSYAIPVEEVIVLARAGKLAQPRRVCGGKHCGDKKAEHVRDVVRALHSGGPHPDRVTTDARSLLLWPDPDEEYAVAETSNAPRLAELFGPDARVEVALARVSVGRSRKVAWAVANLTVRTNDEDALVIRLRGTYVLELVRIRTNEFRWKIVQAHVSVPIEEAELSRRVFGDEL
jgi:hypothetical protein